jgi:hypothetical protein
VRNSKSVLGIAIGLVLVAALMIPPLAFSQGCALCYTQAANSGARMIKALKSGIVILIIPPLSICGGAIALAYRKRNQCNDGDPRVELGSDW